MCLYCFLGLGNLGFLFRGGVGDVVFSFVGDRIFCGGVLGGGFKLFFLVCCVLSVFLVDIVVKLYDFFIL